MFCVVRHSAEPPAFVHCEKEGCGRLTCNTCKVELPRVDEDAGEDEQDALCAAVEHHTQCVAHARVRAELEGVALAFASRQCPGCHTRGIKDDSCTHMTCEHCGTAGAPEAWFSLRLALRILHAPDDSTSPTSPAQA